jgi:hypothetical protein
MMDGEKGTTKYAKDAKGEKIVLLAADERRQKQTFSSADMAEENRLALRATEKNYPTGFTGLCRISFSSERR